MLLFVEMRFKRGYTMNNEEDKELVVENKCRKISTADKAVMVIITVLISVILLCVIFLFGDFGPHNEEVENTAERYCKSYIDFDYDTYAQLIFIDEETYYNLLYTKYAQRQGLTLEEYIDEVNRTDYFPFTFKTIDELAVKLFQNSEKKMLDEFGQWESSAEFERMFEYSDEQLEHLKHELRKAYARTDGDLSDIRGIDISAVVDMDKITAAYEVVLDIEVTFSDTGKTNSTDHRLVVIEYDSQYKVIDNTDYFASHFDAGQFSKEVFSNMVFTDKLLRNTAIRCSVSLVVVAVIMIVLKTKKSKIG